MSVQSVDRWASAEFYDVYMGRWSRAVAREFLPWLDVRPAADGVHVRTALGQTRFDAVIFGTGFDVNLLDRPELGALAAAVDTWGRHVSPEQAAAHPDLCGRCVANLFGGGETRDFA